MLRISRAMPIRLSSMTSLKRMECKSWRLKLLRKLERRRWWSVPRTSMNLIKLRKRPWSKKQWPKARKSFKSRTKSPIREQQWTQIQIENRRLILNKEPTSTHQCRTSQGASSIRLSVSPLRCQGTRFLLCRRRLKTSWSTTFTSWQTMKRARY